MSLFRDIAAAALQPFAPVRSGGLSFDDWLGYFTFNGLNYPLLQQTLSSAPEEVSSDFSGLVTGAYKQSGVVYAVEMVRLLLFSEARFQFRRLNNGKPGDLFGTQELSVLEHPWPGGTTRDLLNRYLLYADAGGTGFAARRFVRPGVREDRITVLRPDWTVVVTGSRLDGGSPLSAELVGFRYFDGGIHSGVEPVDLLPSEVAYFAPSPDPARRYLGQSWMAAALPHIVSHKTAVTHKRKFFENGATVNLVVSLDKDIDPDRFTEFVSKMDEQHKGAANAYKTLYLAGGATATPVGSDLKQLDFKNTQGADETLVAAAAGVPPVIVGLSEGLQAATYSNYGQARRRLADGTMHPLWGNAAHSLQTIIDVPAGAELWYDASHVPFLREDQKDEAEILSRRMLTIESGIRGGYEPDSVVAAVNAGDLSLLKHTGLYSVQLQPPNPDGTPSDAGRSLAQMLAPHLKEILTDGTDRAS